MLSSGYGSMWDGKKNVRAHRFSFMLANGGIASGAVVCHRCDTPSCVNPDHLFAGNQSDNLLDAVSKGRVGTREDSQLYVGVVTDEVAEKIRAERRAGISNRETAARYGVSEGYCSEVARGKRWAVSTLNR